MFRSVLPARLAVIPQEKGLAVSEPFQQRGHSGGRRFGNPTALLHPGPGVTEAAAWWETPGERVGVCLISPKLVAP